MIRFEIHRVRTEKCVYGMPELIDLEINFNAINESHLEESYDTLQEAISALAPYQREVSFSTWYSPYGNGFLLRTEFFYIEEMHYDDDGEIEYGNIVWEPALPESFTTPRTAVDPSGVKYNRTHGSVYEPEIEPEEDEEEEEYDD